ncbi:MAG: LON peptidase substrate-binding domain-containing protein [Aestuariivirgaceae bacterium]
MPGAKGFERLQDLPVRIPIFPLAGALLLPRTQLPLNIFEPRYLAMVDDALAGDRIIGMMQPLSEDASPAAVTDMPAIYGIGCAGRISSFIEVDDNRTLITLAGIARFCVIREIAAKTPYRQVEADYSSFADDLKLGHGEEVVDRQQVLATFRAYLDANGLKTDWNEVRAASNELLVNSLSSIAPFAVAEKQALLEAPSLSARAELLVALTEMSLNRTDGGLGRQLQ